MQTNDTTPDEFLLSELQYGQERAFDFLFRKYYKALCAQANAYVHDIDKAQSLVQNCFIKLWKNRERATEIMNISAYLSSMVRNQCVDYLRSVKSSVVLNENVEISKIISDSEDFLMAREFEEKLVSALSSMPARTRVAFEYSRFDNLTYKEIAVKMNISVKAVEALVSRALKILKTELKDYLPIILLLYKITRF
jgi:RNA polymerase sigma-70 factor (ECF subfamily)